MMNPDIVDYCIKHSSQTSSVAQELAHYTREHVHGSQMLIGELEASVLGFLIKIGDVKNILELGTFTGYSALTMAEHLPADGRITTIDINPHTTAIAQKFWNQSPHGYKINQQMGSGLEVLQTIHDDFDLIFIDADKNNYKKYLLWALDHLSPKGTIVIDNTLWSGKVLERNTDDKQTNSIIEHNDFLAEREDLQKVLLPVRDGMFLVQKINKKS